MNDQAQRIAIAEFCGWKIFPAGKDSFGAWCETHANNGHTTVLIKDLPDYTNDLNAMYQAEEFLNYVQQTRYVALLHPKNIDHISADWRIVHSIPSYRAQCFLKAIDKWVE